MQAKDEKLRISNDKIRELNRSIEKLTLENQVFIQKLQNLDLENNGGNEKPQPNLLNEIRDPT